MSCLLITTAFVLSRDRGQRSLSMKSTKNGYVDRGLFWKVEFRTSRASFRQTEQIASGAMYQAWFLANLTQVNLKAAKNCRGRVNGIRYDSRVEQ